MTWQYWILLSVLITSCSVILQRSVLREEDSKPNAFGIFFQFFNGGLLLLYGVFSGQFELSAITANIGSVLITTILYGAGVLFYFKALKLTEASEFTVIYASRVIFTILASSLILGESLQGKQIIGTLLILSGVLLVTIHKMKIGLKKGELLSLATALFFGLAVTNDRFILQSMNTFTYVPLVFLAPGAFLLATNLKDAKDISYYVHKNRLLKTALICSVHTGAALTFFTALQLAENSSQVAVANLSSVVVTVFLSIIFLKEYKEMWKRIIAGILTFIGLLLIS